MDMESEDLLWKQIYDKMVKQSSLDLTHHEIRLQEADGSFFEKFGSLFREQNQLAIIRENSQKEYAALAAAESNSDQNELTQLPVVQEENDTADVSLSSSDSDSEEHKDDEIISIALNIDELYAEILYEILHNVGCDGSHEIGQNALISYVQDAFHVSNDYHERHLLKAQNKEPPDIMVNVEIIEAKDLAPKDSNGFSDPFVTLYLTSNIAHKYNTSVKSTTLSPVWEEHFALPVANVEDDFLCLEAWDFDPAESVKEKLAKISEIKGIKGVTKFVKEIAATATTGQHENELIGKARIPLNTIPAAGLEMWYSLDKKNKSTRQGVVKVRVSFSSHKISQVSEQEHRHLLKIILLHELETSKVAPHWWCGTFSPQATAILTQHITQSALTPTEVAICQWSVFVTVHQTHALSLSLFNNTLDKLIRPLQSTSVSEDDLKIFWDSTKKFLPFCFNVIKKIKKKAADKILLKSVTEALTIISKLSELVAALPNSELFPENLYSWVKLSQDGDNVWNIMTVLREAVLHSASDWFHRILESNSQNMTEKGVLDKMQFFNEIIHLVRGDLQKSIEFFDKLFQEKMNFEYAKVLYIFYQDKLSYLVEEDIIYACKSLKKLSFTGNTLNEDTHKEPLSEGIKLFEVYLALHRFVLLGKGLCPNGGCDSLQITNFYRWFYSGVAQWLEIAVYKALQRIEKAVELDKLQPIDSSVKYSSSAVDTLTIFYSVKVFWQQLNWPDIEGSYTFIAKIIDDICRCCVFYADRMSKRVEGMGVITNPYETRFEVTNEWCLSINNIEHVSQSLRPFTKQLSVDELIQELSDLKSPLEAERCQHTLDNVIANSIDTVKNEIIELLEVVVSKMAPAMKRLLIEGAELFNQDNNSVDRLMVYVDNNLSTLNRELNEENFNRTLIVIWEELGKILDEIIQNNLEKRRPPIFFSNLRKTLNLMLGSFKNPDDSGSCDSLSRAEELLKIHGMETVDLIHEVHLEQFNDYKKITESPFGILSVRTKFENNKLTIQILNAKNLIGMDSNGLCDSFVRVHILPEDKFLKVDNPQTQTHNKTKFPLFDETFEINFTQEQMDIENGLLLFSVKDKDLLGYNNKHIGEAFIHFKDIPNTSTPLLSLEQVHLQLMRPTNTTAPIQIKAIEQRQTEKITKEFLKKFKQRMGPVAQQQISNNAG